MAFFVGLDLSLRKSGVVVLDNNGKTIAATVIGEPDSKRPCSTNYLRISYFRDMAVLIRDVISLATTNETCEIAIESLVMYSTRTAHLAEMHAIVLLYLLQHKCQHFPPLSLKLWATGSGKATSDKGPQIDACASRFGFVTKSGDLADAYLLAQWIRAGAPRTVPKPKGPKALANAVKRKEAKAAERRRAKGNIAAVKLANTLF